MCPSSLTTEWTYAPYPFELVTDSTLQCLTRRPLGLACRVSQLVTVANTQEAPSGGDLGDGPLRLTCSLVLLLYALSCLPYAPNCAVQVALASGADGVHLGQDDMDVTTARRLLGPNAIIGATAKTPYAKRSPLATPLPGTPV